jgi:hypothetical protein
MPEVVATQLWLAPLFGMLRGTSAIAMPEEANSNAVVTVAATHALGPFFLVMSLLLALAWFGGPWSRLYAHPVLADLFLQVP